VPIIFNGLNCQYTAIATVGTLTLNQGRSAYGAAYPVNYGPVVNAGVWYGFETVNAGTSFAMTAYDIILGTPGSPSATTTNTLQNGTGTAGQFLTAGPTGMGMRYNGSLVVVTTGTAGAINAYWD
jgi:hypothetical protein